MDRYTAGDVAAFDALFRRFAPRLVRFLGPYVGPTHAHDVAQAAFLKVHENRHRYRVGAPVASWIFTIAKNTALDHLRSAPRRREVGGVEADVPQDPVTRDLWQDTQVRAAVETLPADQRDVVLLHWFGGLGLDEVAKVVGTTHGAVRVRASRAYEKLRATLAELAPGGEP
jgi:RNA polymerase sigma-70 factor, ECF subfamily